jgi:hypothetical protein
VVGVWAKELTAAGLFEALRARRTYAATGERITLDVKLNGRPMGSELAATADCQIDVSAEGQDSLAMLELVRNGRVIARHFPEDEIEGPPKLPGRAKCRIQYGWGPWAALGLGRNCPWDMTVGLQGGKFVRALGCFQSAPFGEELRDRLAVVSENEVRLQSPTTRVDCFAEDPTKSLVLELEGGPDAVLTVRLKSPAEKVIRAKLSDLIGENVVEFTGGFTTESLIVHRLVGPGEYSAKVRWNDRRKDTGKPDWYYVRVTQHNGQMAWSSPIWVG